MSVFIQGHLKKPRWNFGLALEKEHMSLLYCKVAMQREKEYLAGDSKTSTRKYLHGKSRKEVESGITEWFSSRKSGAGTEHRVFPMSNARATRWPSQMCTDRGVSPERKSCLFISPRQQETKSCSIYPESFPIQSFFSVSISWLCLGSTSLPFCITFSLKLKRRKDLQAKSLFQKWSQEALVGSADVRKGSNQCVLNGRLPP